MSRIVPSGQPTPGYWLAVTCPRCGGALVHVASGTGGLDTRAVARCDRCRRDYAIVVRLCDVTGELGRPQAVEGHRHGTYGCYTRGCRRPECCQAATLYQRQRRQQQKEAAA